MSYSSQVCRVSALRQSREFWNWKERKGERRVCFTRGLAVSCHWDPPPQRLTENFLPVNIMMSPLPHQPQIFLLIQSPSLLSGPRDLDNNFHLPSRLQPVFPICESNGINLFSKQTALTHRRDFRLTDPSVSQCESFSQIRSDPSLPSTLSYHQKMINVPRKSRVKSQVWSELWPGIDLISNPGLSISLIKSVCVSTGLLNLSLLPSLITIRRDRQIVGCSLHVLGTEMTGRGWWRCGILVSRLTRSQDTIQGHQYLLYYNITI